VVFFIVTGGRIPSYLGCSGSVTSVILSVTGYQYTSTSGLNPNISLVQGALLILSLVYVFVAIIVMFFGYKWLELVMPPGKKHHHSYFYIIAIISNFIL
jgi:putative pyrimidine permease RutG